MLPKKQINPIQGGKLCFQKKQINPIPEGSYASKKLLVKYIYQRTVSDMCELTANKGLYII